MAERAARRFTEVTLAVLVQSGLHNRWWAEAMECYCHLRKLQGLLEDGQRPCERGFNSPFDGPITPFSAEIKFNPISAKDKKVDCITSVPKSFRSLVGYALNAGERWEAGLETHRLRMLKV